ncbi:inositol-pentakisphosphate 2-kinase isoform X2 [Eutrema salsugineum]|uniref:inositol-pentakisphosphate 2-kinase isoform X2 n=1 Tax=Eutrema salsugineum TaxID=72664 RepID=UPI000CED1315|nr:inositol-pentakisphosphate 2-kinase isoform X2 [Eutrema salsugineum]
MHPIGFTEAKEVGKVIRIQKAPKNDKANKSVIVSANGVVSVLTSDEQLLWRDNKELISSTNKEVLEQRYVKHVIIPLMGPKHVDAGVRVSVSKEFLQAVDKKVTKQRPPWRVNAANVDTSHDSALILNDHSLFPQGISSGGDCFSVEIKPKCGFLPTSRFLSEENMLKTSVSRFKMHQILKLEYNEISEVSGYDPLDLFSGSKDRVSEAIKALYSIPQNNFRVFLNGSLILGGSGESTGRTSPEIAYTFEDALKGFIQSDDGLRTKCFLEIVSDAVYSSGVLDKLLEVQKLDKLDIEGAIHSYYNVINQPCPLCKEIGPSEKYASLHALPLDENLKIVKEYMIAATAKDCSLMISFQSRNALDSTPSCDAVCLNSTSQTFDYKVHFIDLSLKPLKRMEAYYKLDKKIISFYTRKQKVKNGEEQFSDPKPSNS